MIVISPTPDSLSSAANLADLGIKFVGRDAGAGPVEQGCHLAVGADVLAQEGELLANLVGSVKPGGFVLLEEAAEVDEKVYKKAGLDLVALQLSENKTYLLLRRVRKMLAFKETN